MVQQILLVNALVLFVFMTAWFLFAKKRGRIDTVDIGWGLGFIVAAWSVPVQQPTVRSIVIAVLVTIWGMRLADHIWQRSKRKGEDPRYEEIAKKWKGNRWVRAYFSIFLLQGLLIWVVSLPVVLAAGEPIHGLGWLTLLGVAIWLKGFVVEAMADHQLAVFLKQKNHPKLLTTGLWKYSRHPNYYGELVQWWGIGIIALQVMGGWAGVIGPLTLTILIAFISGIPPIERRKSKDPEFQAYKKRTSALILWPPNSKQ